MTAMVIFPPPPAVVLPDLLHPTASTAARPAITRRRSMKPPQLVRRRLFGREDRNASENDCTLQNEGEGSPRSHEDTKRGRVCRAPRRIDSHTVLMRAAQGDLSGTPAALRASVPPSLRASVPPSLRASVPPCLR